MQVSDRERLIMWTTTLVDTFTYIRNTIGSFGPATMRRVIFCVYTSLPTYSLDTRKSPGSPFKARTSSTTMNEAPTIRKTCLHIALLANSFNKVQTCTILYIIQIIQVQNRQLNRAELVTITESSVKAHNLLEWPWSLDLDLLELLSALKLTTKLATGFWANQKTWSAKFQDSMDL